MKVDPTTLVTSNRVDVGYRLLFLKYYRHNLSLAKKIYLDAIRVQAAGIFKDPDNSNRVSEKDYVSDFIRLEKSIESRGFDPDVSMIPLSTDGSINNGAHRLAVALHKKIPVNVKGTINAPMDCSVKYFKRFGANDEFLNLAVIELLSHLDSFRVVVLWPSSKDQLLIYEKYFKNNFLTFTAPVTNEGQFNFLFECYHHMPWIGFPSNKYRGILQKRGECFSIGDKPIVILLDENSLIAPLVDLKKIIREECGIGFSSIHSTDSKAESVALSKAFLLDNGQHYIKYGNVQKFNFHQKCMRFKQDIENKKLELEDFVLTGSSTLEAYGLRKAEDIDYLSSASMAHPFYQSHESELKYYGDKLENIIYDPMHFFYVSGVKVLAPKDLFVMKLNRGSSKDQYDMKILSNVLENNSYKEKNFFQNLIIYLRYKRVVIENFMFQALKSLLKQIGILSIVKKIYLRIIKRG